MRLFYPHALRQETKPGENAATVGIDRKDVTIERVKKNASSDFRPDTGKGSEKLFRIGVLHATKRRQRRAAEPCRDCVQHPSYACDFDVRHSSVAN
jgi:hypothetical protein